MRLSIIVAAAKNNVIGRENELPWYLPQDLKYFKSVTLGKPVIMGRKTFESIGKPLPGRTNIVITRQSHWQSPGVLVAQSIKEAIEIAQQFRGEQNNNGDEIMVIGGAEIYRLSLPYVERVYLTRVQVDAQGDAKFPELPTKDWNKTSEIEGDKTATLAHTFYIYDRVRKQL